MTASQPFSVEVSVRAGSRLVDTRALERRGEFRIGEGPRADFAVAVAGAGADGCVVLVEARAEGPWLRVPAGARAELAGRPLAPGDVVKLAFGSCAKVHVGAIEFTVEVCAREPVPAFRPHFDAPAWLAQGASLALFACLALLVRVHAPAPAEPRWDDPELQERLIRYTASISASEPAASRPHRESHPRPAAPTPAPRPAPRPAPEVAPEAPSIPAGLPVPPRGQDPSDLARSAGIFGIPGVDAAVARFTVAAIESSRHYVRSVADDEAWSAAARALPRALEMAATLRGGGGEARGVVDLPVSLIAKVDGSGRRRWAGEGRKESAFAAAAVGEREAPRQDLVWTASVGQDLIRGVVRRNSPEVRRCLREGALRDPSGMSRIEVGFTIAAGGRVREVELDPGVDAELRRCVSAAVKAWTFPTIVAAAGQVSVRYPFSIG